MSSKRLFKKRVRYVCGDMAAECILAKTFINGVDESKMTDIVIRIAQLQEATLKKATFVFDKVSHDFDNKAVYNEDKTKYMKKAFHSLKNEFNQEVHKIVKEMNAVLPQAQKDLNKAGK